MESNRSEIINKNDILEILEPRKKNLDSNKSNSNKFNSSKRNSNKFYSDKLNSDSDKSNSDSDKSNSDSESAPDICDQQNIHSDIYNDLLPLVGQNDIKKNINEYNYTKINSDITKKMDPKFAAFLILLTSYCISNITPFNWIGLFIALCFILYGIMNNKYIF